MFDSNVMEMCYFSDNTQRMSEVTGFEVSLLWQSSWNRTLSSVVKLSVLMGSITPLGLFLVYQCREKLSFLVIHNSGIWKNVSSYIPILSVRQRTPMNSVAERNGIFDWLFHLISFRVLFLWAKGPEHCLSLLNLRCRDPGWEASCGVRVGKTVLQRK